MMTYKAPVYKHLASSIAARLHCIAHPEQFMQWIDRHERQALFIVNNCLPHGSGIDSGIQLDFEQSTGEKLIFTTEFHHMNDVGYYDGWTSHQVIVTPSLQFGLNLHITGRNRNDIKDYLHECIDSALEAVVSFTYDKETDEYHVLA
jgi:trehalose utilization protein